MMNTTKYIAFLFLVSAFYSGCKVFDPDEETPSYLYIKPFEVNVSNPSLGSGSDKITDAWVYVDGSFWGIYELPAYVPYFGTDSTRIIIRPGIKQNGISSKRVYYPFYQSYITYVNALALHTDTIQPTTDYTSVTNIVVNENFEAGNTFENTGGDTTMYLTTNPAEVFEGNQSAYFVIDTAHTEADFTTVSSYFVDYVGLSDIYMELNYKAENNFQIYFTAYTASSGNKIFKLNLTPTDKDGDGIYDWNKIYINFNDEIFLLKPTSFKISVLANLEAGRTQSKIYLDNFKILYN